MHANVGNGSQTPLGISPSSVLHLYTLSTDPLLYTWLHTDDPAMPSLANGGSIDSGRTANADLNRSIHDAV